MTPITPTDIPRLAASIRLTGELIEAHGQLMLQLTNDWTDEGIKAANLDPNAGGNRWETDQDGTTWPIPTDPTGEAILHARNDTAHQLRTRLNRIHDDALWLRDLAHVLAPIVAPSTLNQRTTQDLWCTHHLRIGLAEPRHRGDLCRWCYDFTALWNTRPPIALLRDRHQGKRITDKTIKTALEHEGLLVKEVEGVTKAIQGQRGSTGRPNQNDKRAKTG